MQISLHKLADSCMLVDIGDHRALFDPGIRTWEHDGLDLTVIPPPDRLLITHNHPDHLSIEFVEALFAAYPAMVIETNEEVAAHLSDFEIDATTESTEWTTQFAAPHEPTPTGSQPQNSGFTVGGVFTQPGDSYTLDTTAPVLALPLLPPWGSATEAVRVAKRLKPQYVVPIHDWHLTEGGKQWLFGSATRGLTEEEIAVVPLDDFESVTIELD